MSWLSRIFGGGASEKTRDPDDPVVIAYPDGEETGALWAGMLQDKGIRAIVRDASPLYRGYMNWAAEAELLVRRADAGRARQILGVNEQGVVPDASGADRAPH